MKYKFFNLKTFENFIFEKQNETEIKEFDRDRERFAELNLGYYPSLFTYEEGRDIALFTGNAIHMIDKKFEFTHIAYTDSGFRIFRSEKSKMKFRVVKYKSGNNVFFTIDLTHEGEPTRYFRCSTLKSCLYKIKELEQE